MARVLDVTLLVQSETTPERGLARTELGAPELLLDAGGRPAMSPAEKARASASPLTDVAVVHWSSGSTGEPKPIAVSAPALAERAGCLARAAPFSTEDRTLCALPLSHCHGIECLAMPTLAAGAELVLLDPLRAGAERVARWIERHRITFFSALPRFYEELLRLELDPAGLASLRMPMCGSAALHPQTSRRFAERFGMHIGQGYGLTEIGVICLNQHAHRPLRYDSVGPVLEGIEWRIDNPDEEGVGELWVRSPGCAPYVGAAAGQGWLRTQDLVRADDDGYLYLTGRCSGFLNVNGAKADPHEIERAVEELDWVGASAVRGWTDERGLERIACYVEPAHGAPPVEFPAEEVQRQVAERLTIFKVPTWVVCLDRLPRTPLGKMAYARLPWPGAGQERQAQRGEPSRPPRDEAERSVAALWAEVLGLDRVDLRTGFASLGGTSLQMVTLLERLNQRFGRELALVDLFRLPTVEAQAAELGRHPGNGAAPAGGDVASAVEAARERAARQRRAFGRPPT